MLVLYFLKWKHHSRENIQEKAPPSARNATDANLIMSCLERVRPKVYNAPTTMLISHSQRATSTSKVACTSGKSEKTFKNLEVCQNLSFKCFSERIGSCASRAEIFASCTYPYTFWKEKDFKLTTHQLPSQNRTHRWQNSYLKQPNEKYLKCQISRIHLIFWIL